MRTSSPRFGGLLALCLLGAACVRDPTVRLDHAELNGVQLTSFPPRLGIVLTLAVDITNPNGFDVAVRGMRGQVAMMDRYPVNLDFRPPPPGIWLRAGSTTPVRMPVDMPIETAAAVLRESFASPVVEYRVQALVDVTGSSTFKVNRDNFPVDLRGSVTRAQVAGVVPAIFLPH